MAKQRAAKPDKPAAKPAAAPAPGGWSLWFRLLVSLAVTWHVFAVFISPFPGFTAPPTSDLLRNIATSKWVRWYSDPMYINGGYQFFSPDPPRGGMLLRYAITDDTGATVAEGEFPNRANEDYDRQWPRLWYHRHMMLADQTGGEVVYTLPNGAPDAEANLRLTLRSYARHLLRKHGGSAIRLDYIEHRSLFYDEVRANLDPTDPRLYTVVASVTESADSLGSELLPPEPIAPPEQLPTGEPAPAF